MSKNRNSFDKVREALRGSKKRKTKVDETVDLSTPPNKPLPPTPTERAQRQAELARSNSDSSLSNSDESIFSVSDSTSRSVSPQRGISPSRTPREKAGWSKQQPSKVGPVPSYLGAERRLLAAYDEIDPDDQFQRVVNEFKTTEETFKSGIHTLVTACNNILKDKDRLMSLDLTPRQIELMKNYLQPYEFIDTKFNILTPTSKLQDILNIQNANFNGFVEATMNYEKAQAFFSELFKQNPKLDSAMKEELKAVSGRGASFDAYIITVVQRVPRYILLANDLVKKNPYPEGAAMLKTLAKNIESVAAGANQAMTRFAINEQLKPFLDIIRADVLVQMANTRNSNLFDKFVSIEENDETYKNKMTTLLDFVGEIKKYKGPQFHRDRKSTAFFAPSAEIKDLLKAEKILVIQVWKQELEAALTSLKNSDPENKDPKDFKDAVNILQNMIDKWNKTEVSSLFKKDVFSKFEKEYGEFFQKLSKDVVPKLAEIESQSRRFAPDQVKPSALITKMTERHPELIEQPAPARKLSR